MLSTVVANGIEIVYVLPQFVLLPQDERLETLLVQGMALADLCT